MSLGVLLVEGWMAGSHEAWARGWQQRSRHRIGIVGQPGTHWQHRMVAGAVPLARETARHVDLHGTPDVVVATDMVDLPSWRGLCASMVRGGLAGVPTVLYLHENQMTQPPSPNGVADGRGRHLAWTNWRSLVAADAIWSNSRWQLDSAFESLADLLGSSPDDDAQLPLLEAVRSRCSVQPVGCDLQGLLAAERTDPVPSARTLWSQAGVSLWPTAVSEGGRKPKSPREAALGSLIAKNWARGISGPPFPPRSWQP